MTASCAQGSISVPRRRRPILRRLAAWLRIAAAPTFAGMAVVCQATAGHIIVPICGGGSPVLNEMATMYLLMGLFHSPPWLRLIGNRLNRHRGRVAA